MAAGFFFAASGALTLRSEMVQLDPPNPSMRYITRHELRSAWRVDVPPRAARRPEERWFFDVDYGGTRQALVEAQYARDDCFEGAQLPLHARLKLGRAQIESGEYLRIRVIHVRRGEYVEGHWQEDVDGQTRCRRVCRSVSLYGREEAWRQVREIVLQGVLDEAAKFEERYRRARAAPLTEP